MGARVDLMTSQIALYGDSLEYQAYLVPRQATFGLCCGPTFRNGKSVLQENANRRHIGRRGRRIKRL